MRSLKPFHNTFLKHFFRVSHLINICWLQYQICLSFMKACMNSSWKLTSSNPFCSKIIYLVSQLFFIYFSPDTHSKEFKWLELTVLTNFNICQLLDTRKFLLQRALILLLWCCKRRRKFCPKHVSLWNLDLICDVQKIFRLKANIWEI